MQHPIDMAPCPFCGGQAIVLNKNGRWCAECTGKPAQVPDDDVDPEIDEYDEYDEGLDPEDLDGEA